MLEFIKNHYSLIAIGIAVIISVAYMFYKGTMNSNKVAQVALSSLTLFPPIVLMLSVIDDSLLTIMSQDKTVLFISGFVLTLHIANDIKEKFTT